MLFSPPSEFGKQFFYRIIGISCGIHLGLLLLFFIGEALLGMRPMVVSLRGKGGRVSMVTSRRPNRGARRQATGRLRRKKVSPRRKAPAKKTVRKKTPAKKVPPKKKAPVKKTVAKKAPVKKKPLTKAPVKKAPVKKKMPPKPVKKVAAKKAPTKAAPKKAKAVKAVLASAVPANAVPANAVPAKAGGATPEQKEVHVAEAAWSPNDIEREFGRHFTIPAGFEEYESFTITFDIKDSKVVNVSPHTKGALVVYTAVKDALLKSTMPIKNRKHIVWLIT